MMGRGWENLRDVETMEMRQTVWENPMNVEMMGKRG
jgi:hypothetical protein